MLAMACHTKGSGLFTTTTITSPSACAFKVGWERRVTYGSGNTDVTQTSPSPTCCSCPSTQTQRIQLLLFKILWRSGYVECPSQCGEGPELAPCKCRCPAELYSEDSSDVGGAYDVLAGKVIAMTQR
jgi:hypothetical protein